MIKCYVIGNGAAGSKCVASAVKLGAVRLEDTAIVNSTSKDFPADYEGKKIILSPENHGAGKERPVAKEFAKRAIAEGLFDFPSIEEYATVIIVTSVEGGTGSGSTPLLANYFSKVHTRNVHIIAFAGFGDDVRGLANTVDFCKEIDPSIMVQMISNASFMADANSNKLKAEELANAEMIQRISVLTGQDFIEGSQNIDDTDILKLSNTAGYMNVEKLYLKKPLETREDYEKAIKKMLYNTHSVKPMRDPKRLGVILNITEESKDAVDFSFASIKEAFGIPYETFTQVQYDGNKEYIAFIASGMKLPVDAIKETYDKYVEESNRINKEHDEFLNQVKSMSLLEEDSNFDMIRGAKKSVSLDDFLSNN